MGGCAHVVRYLPERNEVDWDAWWASRDCTVAEGFVPRERRGMTGGVEEVADAEKRRKETVVQAQGWQGR